MGSRGNYLDGENRVEKKWNLGIFGGYMLQGDWRREDRYYH